jgi:hypothetical protein
MKKSKTNEDEPLHSADQLLKESSTENILVFLVLAIFILVVIVFSNRPDFFLKNNSQPPTASTEKYVWLAGTAEVPEGLYLFTPEQLENRFPTIDSFFLEEPSKDLNSLVYAVETNEDKLKQIRLPPEVANIFFKPIPINRADIKILISLPGIGSVLAERIVMRRNKYGPFQSKDELLQIAGIGPKKYAGLVNRITLD